ncbi:hypothetical protein Q9R46_10815 [Paenibacillus sp. RRE4]|nr:hypothetical protein [Paenibacillus sp. RRE4]MDT0123133.1 hypothetical protein [Paenibacillus sp. RRE4]
MCKVHWIWSYALNGARAWWKKIDCAYDVYVKSEYGFVSIIRMNPDNEP